MLERFPELGARARGARLAERLRPLAGARDRRGPRGARARSCCARSRATRPPSSRGPRRRARARLPLSRSTPAAPSCSAELEGVRLDDLARACARELRAGRRAGAGAELTLEIGDDGEPELALYTRLGPRARARLQAPARGAPGAARTAASSTATARWGVAVPGDPALAPALAEFVGEHPEVERRGPRAASCSTSCMDEHDRAAETVALSYAEDAELDGLELGGELHPFQRAGVRYALERRRTFIADEQGLGKTVQALATLEADDAFPAVVVCPASMKLMWERESLHWLPRAERGGARRARRGGLDRGGRARPRSWCSTTTSSRPTWSGWPARRPRALVLDESHYVKNPRARRTKAALELAGRLPDGRAAAGAHRHADPEPRPRSWWPSCACSAACATSAAAPGSRAASARPAATTACTGTCARTATCGARSSRCCRSCPPSARTPCRCCSSNEHEYRLAETDVIAWLQSLPLDLRHDRRQGRRRAARGAARAAQQPAPARRSAASSRPRSPGSGTSSPRASRSWCSPSTSRSSGPCSSASRTPRTSSAPTRRGRASRRWTPSSARTARS